MATAIAATFDWYPSSHRESHVAARQPYQRITIQGMVDQKADNESQCSGVVTLLDVWLVAIETNTAFASKVHDSLSNLDPCIFQTN